MVLTNLLTGKPNKGNLFKNSNLEKLRKPKGSLSARGDLIQIIPYFCRVNRYYEKV